MIHVIHEILVHHPALGHSVGHVVALAVASGDSAGSEAQRGCAAIEVLLFVELVGEDGAERRARGGERVDEVRPEQAHGADTARSKEVEVYLLKQGTLLCVQQVGVGRAVWDEFQRDDDKDAVDFGSLDEVRHVRHVRARQTAARVGEATDVCTVEQDSDDVVLQRLHSGQGQLGLDGVVVAGDERRV